MRKRERLIIKCVSRPYMHIRFWEHICVFVNKCLSPAAEREQEEELTIVALYSICGQWQLRPATVQVKNQTIPNLISYLQIFPVDLKLQFLLYMIWWTTGKKKDHFVCKKVPTRRQAQLCRCPQNLFSHTVGLESNLDSLIYSHVQINSKTPCLHLKWYRERPRSLKS